MEFTHELHEEENLIKNVFNRFMKRNFSGDSGQAIKNSTFQFSQNLIYKLGSLIFTIIIARLLLPDKMGLYNLALSTIVLLSVFSDLGIGEAILTFVSKMSGVGKNAKANGYFKKLFKWKKNLILFSSILILVVGFILSKYYYQKPIFYAILVGILYQPIVSLIGFFENLFKANENFRIPLQKEIVFQILRFVIVPFVLILFLNKNYSDEIFVMITLIAIVVCYSFSLLFLYLKLKKISFLKHGEEKLNVNEISGLKKFIYPLSSVALAGVFFGYIDTLMLGRYVSTSYIAYYSAAFSLVASGAAIIGFASIALMPIFAKKSGDSLEKIFMKTRNFVVLISVLGALFAYLISYYAVRYAYGVSYLPAVPILQAFSLMILFLPLLGLYNSYFVSQGRTKEVAWLLIGSTVLNIILNIFGIQYGLNNYGEIGALYGALGATIFSRIIYLAGFFWLRGKKE